MTLYNKQKEKRLYYLDMVKGIGIILVVTGHSGYAPDPLLTWITSFHMPLFFIVSGMLLAHKKAWNEDFKTFLIKRLKGMMIPYLLFSVIYNLVYFWFFKQHPELYIEGFFVNSALETLSGYGMSVLWFLSSIFLGEVCFYLLAAAYIKSSGAGQLPSYLKAVFAVLMLAGLSYIPVIVKSLLEAGIQADRSIYLKYLDLLLRGILRVPSVLIFLFAGCIIYNVLEKKEPGKSISIIIGICCMCLNAAAAFQNGRVDMHFLIYNRLLLFYAAAISGALGLIFLLKEMKEIWILEFFGANSLIVMLTHLDCLVLSNGILFANILNNYIPRAKDLFFRFNLCMFLIAVELFFVIFINRFAFFLIGKNAPVKMKYPVFLDRIIKNGKSSNIKRIK